MNGWCIVLLSVSSNVPGSTVAQIGAGWLATLPIAALAIYGWVHGVFHALIAGLQVLAAFLIAMTCLRPVSAGLELVGCPAGHSLAIAYWVILAVCLAAIRIAVNGYVQEGVVRFSRVIDHCGGMAFGAMAGASLGGTLLVGWSLTNGPAWSRFDADQLIFDGGRRMLWTFARFMESGHDSAAMLFSGDPLMKEKNNDTPVVFASEPFVDSNGNGIHDADVDEIAERYLDLDDSGDFSSIKKFIDHNGDGLRRIGLMDCYRLAAWTGVRCQHAPRITSIDSIEIIEEGPREEIIYTVTASDVDAGDVVTYEVLSDDEHIAVSVDPTTGVITLLEPIDYETVRGKRHAFVVRATDKSNLTTEKEVTVRVRDKPD